MKQFVIIVLIVLGFYFLLIHTAPLPFNHEDIGLGPNHNVHRIFGIVLLAVAGLLWWKGRKKLH